ncbi:MAG: HAMP domain-containing histidine kinase [Chloroflexi bacterium]|nr:HAMP domain-containing histidine kinase [Chloroflexota bacterium]
MNHHKEPKQPDETKWLLAQITHMLIAPLNGLQAHVDNLIIHYEDWDDKRILQVLETIRSTSRWMARVTMNFALIAQSPRPDGNSHSNQWVKLKPLLSECVTDILDFAKFNRVTIKLDDSVQDSQKVFVDRILFGLAISNLLENAVKYALADTDVHIAVASDESFLKICITDYGVPLSGDDIRDIFEFGFRGESATIKVAAGAGIGLPIARKILQDHDGDILVQPSTFNPAQNAHEVTFLVLLPLSLVRME